MPTKQKSYLSLKRPKWRKKNESRPEVSYRRTIENAELVIHVQPPFKYRTEVKTSSLFTSNPLMSNRKFSPFKSPLTKIKIPKSPALRKSPMTKRLKNTSAK